MNWIHTLSYQARDIHILIIYIRQVLITIRYTNCMILSLATNLRSGQRRSLRSILDPTGTQQDCLGMTPLHILACSTVDDLSLYQLLIEKYPEGLITEDRFGALPLLYIYCGDAT